MFDNFKFSAEKELVSDEIRKLVTEVNSFSEKEEIYIKVWKRKMLELSGQN